MENVNLDSLWCSSVFFILRQLCSCSRRTVSCLTRTNQGNLSQVQRGRDDQGYGVWKWRVFFLLPKKPLLSWGFFPVVSACPFFVPSVTHPFNSMSHVPFPSLPYIAQWCPNIHSRRRIEQSASIQPSRLKDSKKAVGRSNCTDRNISHSILMLRQCYLLYAVGRYFHQFLQTPFPFFPIVVKFCDTKLSITNSTFTQFFPIQNSPGNKIIYLERLILKFSEHKNNECSKCVSSQSLLWSHCSSAICV